MPESIVVGTRFWGKEPADLLRLDRFLNAAQQVGERVLVAVNVEADETDTVAHMQAQYNGVEPIIVTKWGFAPALNALIESALPSHRHMLFASVEYPPNPEAVDILQSLTTGNVVYAGAVLEDHDYLPGKVIKRATAAHVPRNTYAVVNLPLLGETMIPAIVDTLERPEMAGMEEVATLAYQELLGNTSYLISVPGVENEFNTYGWTDERIAKHAAKVASKNLRAEYQLKCAKLDPPTVVHL